MAIIGTLETEMESTSIFIKQINPLVIKLENLTPNDYNVKCINKEWIALSKQLVIIINNLKAKDEILLEAAKKDYQPHFYNINEILKNTAQILKSATHTEDFKDNSSVTHITNLMESLKKELYELTMLYLLSCPDFSSEIVSTKKKLDNLNQTIQTTKNLAENDLKIITSKILETNELSSKSELGKSFLNRSAKLEDISNCWLISVFFSIVLLIGYSLYVLYTFPEIDYDYDKLNFLIRKLIFNIPVFIATLWLLWFSCKQYTESCRLRDDYHFKYDLSNAFYGYNEQVKNLSIDDTTMQLALLDIVLKNIGNNPTDNHDDNGCNSPYAEMLEKASTPLEKMGKLIDKIKGKNDPV